MPSLIARDVSSARAIPRSFRMAAGTISSTMPMTGRPTVRPRSGYNSWAGPRTDGRLQFDRPGAEWRGLNNGGWGSNRSESIGRDPDQTLRRRAWCARLPVLHLGIHHRHQQHVAAAPAQRVRPRLYADDA